jgi:hypothetical protein
MDSSRSGYEDIIIPAIVASTCTIKKEKNNIGLMMQIESHIITLHFLI